MLARSDDSKLKGRSNVTKSEALQYIASCDEDGGPETREEAVELFEALFGSAPDPEDDQGMIWSHVCAAAVA